MLPFNVSSVLFALQNVNQARILYSTHQDAVNIGQLSGHISSRYLRRALPGFHLASSTMRNNRIMDTDNRILVRKSHIKKYIIRNAELYCMLSDNVNI